MIIKDVNGERLELTKTKLVEKTGICCPELKWRGYFLLLKDLQNPVPTRDYDCGLAVTCYAVKPDNWHAEKPIIKYDSDECVIGCRTFSPATFAKILKAAGVVRKTDKKPAKKGKK